MRKRFAHILRAVADRLDPPKVEPAGMIYGSPQDFTTGSPGQFTIVGYRVGGDS